MLNMRMKVILFVMFCITIPYALAHNHEEQCISGKYHKQSPSTETTNYHHCQPWKNLTCCTAEFTKELVMNETRTLYNHSWHRCGQLSQKCLKFWFEQECFYQCSPYVYQWKDPNYGEAIRGVPICSDYCDRWFDACRHDKLCVTDVLTGYNYSIHGENFCPNDENCTTYADRFKNGEGLCTKMWSTSYIYQKPNSDRSNCMVMWFNNSNPNSNVKRALNPTGGAHKTVLSALHVTAIVVIVMATVGIFQS